MKHIVVIAATVLALIISACGTTNYVPRNTIKVRTFDLNTETQLWPTRVLLNDSTIAVPVDYFSIVADSALWLAEDTQLPMSVPLGSVREITVRNRGIGLAIGSLIGFGVGLVFDFTVVRERVGYGTVFPVAGLIGLLGGEITGSIIGWPVTYVFGSEP